MIPRRDPETVPLAAPVQVLKRRQTDQYGTERNRDTARHRPLAMRNGVPVRPYRYRGTGDSMTETEAAWWLSGVSLQARKIR